MKTKWKFGRKPGPVKSWGRTEKLAARQAKQRETMAQVKRIQEDKP